MQWSTRYRRFPLRKSITRWFIRHYQVDMSEALEPDPDAYPDFRRSKNLHPHHKSYHFFLTDKGVSHILHESYIDLVSGKSINMEVAGQTYRLADWYMKTKDDVPQKLVNETYSWLTFDDSGRVDLHAAKAIEASPMPTEKEHE